MHRADAPSNTVEGVQLTLTTIPRSEAELLVVEVVVTVVDEETVGVVLVE